MARVGGTEVVVVVVVEHCCRPVDSMGQQVAMMVPEGGSAYDGRDGASSSSSSSSLSAAAAEETRGDSGQGDPGRSADAVRTRLWKAVWERECPKEYLRASLWRKMPHGVLLDGASTVAA